MVKPDALEIPYKDPLTAFAPFADDPVSAFLDSADEAGGRGRYAFIAADPIETINVPAGGISDTDPFRRLKDMLSRVRLDHDPVLPPFQTGLCGVLGYELGGVLERLPPAKPGPAFPALCVGLYDTIAAFDTFEHRAWIISSDIDPARPSAPQRRQLMAAHIAAAPNLAPPLAFQADDWVWEMDRDAYMAAVQRAVDYIYAGDIFQANITTRAMTKLPVGVDAFTIYRRLRWASPAPFAAYLGCGVGTTLVSASPERFLKLEPSGRITTRPIKGTRPRADTPEQDAAYAVELTESAKDRAENLMIVDLLRNDISRVALIGSVGVDSLHELETFARVHHLVSQVHGRLRPGYDAIDLFRATFPGGSITGAPKIRAMEIIHELERSRRGVYCGSVFWAGLDGTMDSNIVIRSLVVDGDTVSAHAGGGIVADSDPAEEYDEMRTKAQPLLASLSGDARDQKTS
tara:strand:- start:308178 stop:309557 length:1380 start_codon:yes stop_codon:yes gene_type:complete